MNKPGKKMKSVESAKKTDYVEVNMIEESQKI
jgi:hypothetical protein